MVAQTDVCQEMSDEFILDLLFEIVKNLELQSAAHRLKACLAHTDQGS